MFLRNSQAAEVGQKLRDPRWSPLRTTNLAPGQPEPFSTVSEILCLAFNASVVFTQSGHARLHKQSL